MAARYDDGPVSVMTQQTHMTHRKDYGTAFITGGGTGRGRP